MKKIQYILFLFAMAPGLKAQFAAVLTDKRFTRLENDSALLSPYKNLRGTFRWQKSTDSINWAYVESNLSGDILTFVPEVTEVYRLQITEGTCLPLYSDTVKIFSKNTTVSEYHIAGISNHQLLAAGASVSDLLAAGVSVIELFDAGILVGSLEQSGADSSDLANAGLIGILTDFDNTDYKWVRIGDQIWMAENLKTTHDANGSAIPLTENTSDWGNLGDMDEAYCYFDNSSAKGNTYGAIYTWSASINVCPSGWHLPNDDEWKQLEISLGMSQTWLDGKGLRGTNEGSKLAGNASLWNQGNLENNVAFGNSGFASLPGGFRHTSGTFHNLGINGGYWTATEYSSSNVWLRSLYNDSSGLGRATQPKTYGLYVRCTKD